MRQVLNSSLSMRGESPAPYWSVVLRALREALGLSQEGWAARLGYGRRTIQRWEHAELAPDARAADALVGLCADEGLFRAYSSGVLAGETFSEAGLRILLAEARVAAPDDDVTVSALALAGRPRLPSALTSFIGRQQELADLRRHIRTTRLLTLTGPGGVGKTRLAVEVARIIEPDFPDGVWFVELASLADARLVSPTVAAALGVHEKPGREALATLADRLRDRCLAIVLDNCEHIVSACAELAATLLRECAHVCILVTSRSPLGISGERAWPVPALFMRKPEDGLVVWDGLAESEAVQLFVERARAVVPDFAITADGGSVLADVCRQLDGLPLAIELAAAWMRVLSPQELGRRLVDAMALLVGGAQDAPARHQTLRATLDWSYRLLFGADQRLLARLSVFAGGATLDAIECVGKAARDAHQDILQGLARLVDASLVQRLESPGAESRYRLLETVRQYAAERLVELAEVDHTRRRHALLFRDLAEEGRSYLRGPEQAAWLDRLEREHDNLRAALHWGLESQDAELCGRLAASLWAFWYRRGHVREGRAQLGAALALSAVDAEASIRIHMLQGSALLAQHEGDYAAARAYAEQGVAIARERGDPREMCEILGALGFVSRVQGDWEPARHALEESLALARDCGNVFSEAATMHHLGLLALEADQDSTRAWSFNQASLVLFRRLVDYRMESNVLLALARVARAEGDVANAAELVVGASKACQEVGDDGIAVYILHERAAIAFDTGEFEQAVRLTAAAARMSEWLGQQVHPVIAGTRIRESERLLSLARRALGDQRFALACADGQSWTIQRTVAQMLDTAPVAT